MTLIVGMLCNQGVVLAADGAATLGSMGTWTARQPVKKLELVGDRVAIGVSGPVGLSQLLTDRLRQLWQGGKLSGTLCKTSADAMRVLSEEFKKDVHPALHSAQIAAGVLGHQTAAASAICSVVVALPIAKHPSLLQFDQQCTPEAATKDLPFVAVGIGQRTADPFLAFLRRVFWPDRLPNVAEGIFAATWTLRQAIETSPGGVADPIQVMVLEGEAVREVGIAELGEHEQNVSAAEQYMSDFKHKFSGTPANTEQPPQAEKKV